MNEIRLTLQVDSLERAIDFYCNTLGLFEVAFDARDDNSMKSVVVLAHRDESLPFYIIFVLDQNENTDGPIRKPAITLGLYHSDLERLEESLKKAGFNPTLEWIPLGRDLSVVDPFGHLLNIADRIYGW